MGNHNKQPRLSLDQPKSTPASPPEAPVVPAARQFTVELWARGRNDALTRAFIAEHAQARTVKRSAAEWSEIYNPWLKKPR